MSEYQYDEFQAIDRPLAEADMRALRALSTRAAFVTGHAMIVDGGQTV